jgi:hypothetical protein
MTRFFSLITAGFFLLLLMSCNKGDHVKDDLSGSEPHKENLSQADKPLNDTADVKGTIPPDSITRYISLSIWNHKLEMEMPEQVVLLKNTRGNALLDLGELINYDGIQRARLDLHQFPCIDCTPDAHEVYEGYYEPGEYHQYDTIISNEDTIIQEHVSYIADTTGGIEHFYLTWLDGYHHKFVGHFYIYHSVDDRIPPFDMAVKRLLKIARGVFFSAVKNSYDNLDYPLIDLAVSLKLDCILGGYSGSQWFSIDELLRVDTDYIYLRSGKDTLMSNNHFYCYSQNHYLFPAMAFVNQGNLQQYLEVHTNSQRLVLNYGQSPNHWLALTSSHNPFPTETSRVFSWHSSIDTSAESVPDKYKLLSFLGAQYNADYKYLDMEVLEAAMGNDGLKDTLTWFTGQNPVEADDSDLRDNNLCAPGAIVLRRINYGSGQTIETKDISRQKQACAQVKSLNVIDLNGDEMYEIVEQSSKSYHQHQYVYEIQGGKLNRIFSTEWWR